MNLGDIIHRRRGKAKAKPTILTKRQRHVVALITDGVPHKGVGESLGISIKTVEKHKQDIYAKLGIHDTATLTHFAIAHGIVNLKFLGPS